MSKMARTENSVIAWSFNLLNILTLLAGLLMMVGAGMILGLAKTGSISQPSSPSMVYGILAVGLFITVASVLGCCGVLTRSTKLIYAYLLLLTALVAVQIALAIMVQQDSVSVDGAREFWDNAQSTIGLSLPAYVALLVVAGIEALALALSCTLACSQRRSGSARRASMAGARGGQIPADMPMSQLFPAPTPGRFPPPQQQPYGVTQTAGAEYAEYVVHEEEQVAQQAPTAPPASESPTQPQPSPPAHVMTEATLPEGAVIRPDGYVVNADGMFLAVDADGEYVAVNPDGSYTPPTPINLRSLPVAADLTPADTLAPTNPSTGSNSNNATSRGSSRSGQHSKRVTASSSPVSDPTGMYGTTGHSDNDDNGNGGNDRPPIADIREAVVPGFPQDDDDLQSAVSYGSILPDDSASSAPTRVYRQQHARYSIGHVASSSRQHMEDVANKSTVSRAAVDTPLPPPPPPTDEAAARAQPK